MTLWPVIWMVVRDAWMVLAIGLAAGLPAGIVGNRLLTAMLYGVSQTDPVSIAWALLALLGVCFAAAILSARRATRVDPMVALRYE